MFKKLVPVVVALLIAGPIFTATTAIAADSATTTAKAHHKVVHHVWHKNSDSSSR